MTTNYDPGIVDARLRVRTWLIGHRIHHLGRRTGPRPVAQAGILFDQVELPVLYAHGYFNRPDSVVLATTEYRRAY